MLGDDFSDDEDLPEAMEAEEASSRGKSSRGRRKLPSAEGSEEVVQQRPAKQFRKAAAKPKPHQDPEKVVLGKALKEQKALFSLLLKSVLQQQQKTRDMEGALYYTFLIPVDCGVAASAGKQGQRYAKAVAHKWHGLGPPH